MGQPLHLAVPMNWGSDEILAPECVRAEVMAGELWLPANQVRVRVKQSASPGQWQIEVDTSAPILEPLVQVRVSVTCGAQIVRTFTVFADPPGSAASAGPLQNPPLIGMLPNPSVNLGASDEGKSEVAQRGAAQPRKKSRVRVDGLAPEPPKSSTRALTQAAPQATREHRGKNAPGARLELEVGAGPLLKMDLDEPIFMGQSAATAGVAAAESLAEQQRRDKVLSESLSSLKSSTTALEASNEQLRQRALAAETRSQWLAALVGALLISAAGALVFWRRSLAGKASAPAWWADEKSELSEPAGDELGLDEHAQEPEFHYEVAPLPPLPREPVRVDAELPLELAQPVMAHEQTMALLPRRPLMVPDAEAEAQAAGLPLDIPLEASRPVSVEELMDVEQQADFFVALGQDDAAIEVLMASLRGNGGQSPVPYSKLLEIYRRQGDRAAYERIRGRFNRRFNVYAPDWETEPHTGSELEAYPEAVQELQVVWPTPLDAMAVLEAMLFRRDERLVLFDLPAYLDLLLLYAIAREHWQLGGGGLAEEVDLLLPLSEQAADGPHGFEMAGLEMAGDVQPPSEHVLLDFEHDLLNLELESPPEANPFTKPASDPGLPSR